MFWRDILKEMGFYQIDGYSNIYKSKYLGDSEFSFTGRESTDAIAAEIWDVAQHYGENKMKNQVSRNLFREL